MEIIKLSVGQLQVNCYLVGTSDANRCFIIDPGDAANFISEEILRRNWEPQAIIATHGHFDHILAAYELQLAFDIPFWIHPGDKKLLGRAVSSARHWLKREVVTKVPVVDREITAKDSLKLGNVELGILATPGHTPGGITLYNEAEKIAFVGDTIFKNGVGRADFSYSSPPQLQQSVKKVRQQLVGYTAYPGHGEEFIID